MGKGQIGERKTREERIVVFRKSGRAHCYFMPLVTRLGPVLTEATLRPGPDGPKLSYLYGW